MLQLVEVVKGRSLMPPAELEQKEWEEARRRMRAGVGEAYDDKRMVPHESALSLSRSLSTWYQILVTRLPDAGQWT